MYDLIKSPKLCGKSVATGKRDSIVSTDIMSASSVHGQKYATLLNSSVSFRPRVQER